MSCRVAPLLIPLLVYAQAPAAPKKVEQALRARASEFLQDHVQGNFRKALDLVAEDSKDYYLTATKSKLFSFKIEGLEYSDKFTKAVVTSTVRKTRFGAVPLEITVTQTDNWKLENGKWMWYNQAPAGPTGGLAALIPKDHSPAALEAEAKKIGAGTSVNKESLTFTAGEAGTEEVVFHNGNPGPVKLLCDIIGNPEEFRADPITTLVDAGKDVTVRVIYTPQKGPEIPATFRISVEPLLSEFRIPITRVTPAEPAPDK